jgi:hypothetical protein
MSTAQFQMALPVLRNRKQRYTEHIPYNITALYLAGLVPNSPFINDHQLNEQIN